MTGPLSEAVEAADRIWENAIQADSPDAALVAQCAGQIVECLRGAEPPYGGTSEDDIEARDRFRRALCRLRERCDEWEKIYDQPHIHTVEELQTLEYADDLGVPPSWVRSHVEPRDIRMWGDFQDIKQRRIDRQVGGDEKVEIG